MLTVVTDEARAVELDASDVVPLTFLSPHFLLLGFLSINAALKVLFLKVLCITEEICFNYLQCISSSFSILIDPSDPREILVH